MANHHMILTKQLADRLIAQTLETMAPHSIEELTSDMIDWIIECLSDAPDFDEEVEEECKGLDFPTAALYIEKKFEGGICEFISLGNYQYN